MAHSYDNKGLVPLADDDIEASRSILGSNDFPKVWLVFCHVFAGLVTVTSVAILIAGAITLVYDEYVAMAFGATICLILTSIPAGICAPIAVVYASHKSVVGWIITHSIFLVLNIIYLVLIFVSTYYVVVGALAGAMVGFQLIFCCLYGPLTRIKNLQRPPRSC